MSMSIVNNAGTLVRAGFDLFKDGKKPGLFDALSYQIMALNPLAFIEGIELRPASTSFSDSLFMTSYYTTFYWPTAKSPADWRGGRLAF